MKKILTLSLALLAVAGSAFANSAYKEITSDELVKLKETNKDLVIIDSRGGKWFDGTMIEGAINLSTADTTEESLAKVLKTKDSEVVFYCTNHDCPASAEAATKAASFGYKNIKKFPGGIEEWVKKGLKTTKVEVKAEAAKTETKEEKKAETK